MECLPPVAAYATSFLFLVHATQRTKMAIQPLVRETELSGLSILLSATLRLSFVWITFCYGTRNVNGPDDYTSVSFFRQCHD